jgi:beta-glucanase (GH16 family)
MNNHNLTKAGTTTIDRKQFTVYVDKFAHGGLLDQDKCWVIVPPDNPLLSIILDKS